MNPPENAWHVFKRLVTYMLPMKHVFFIAVLALIVYGSVDAVFVSLLKPFVDQGFVGQQGVQTPGVETGVDVLALAPLIIILLFVIRGLANFLSSYSLSHISSKLILVLRQEVFEHYLKLPVSYVDHQNSGNLISRVTYDIEQVARASGGVLTSVIRDTVTLIAYVTVMFCYSWKLSLCIFVSVPLIAFLIVHVSKRFRKISLQIQASMGSVSVVTDQVIKGHKNVLMFGGQDIESQRFLKANEHNRSRKMKLALASAVSQPLIMIIGSFSLALVLYLASLDGIRQGLTAGTFASFFTAMVSLFRPIKGLTRVNNEFQCGIAAAASVFNLLDEPSENDKGNYIAPSVKGNIEFQNVSFRYLNQEKPALNRINLSVASGKTLALVGRSGSGKSTLTNLITRFYDDMDSGAITLDGKDIKDYKLRNLRSHMALVSQQVMLFDDTVANNIAYACGDSVSRADIEKAAQLAFAYDFINELPQGFDTLVGENGVLLSGGQRQRIAIARAILRNAPILILDEATSALDTESERAIQKALDNLSRDRTCIVIAHRLSTIENADEIAVIDQGTVVEQGSHGTLLKKQGMYAQLHQMQFNAA